MSARKVQRTKRVPRSDSGCQVVTPGAVHGPQSVPASPPSSVTVLALRHAGAVRQSRRVTTEQRAELRQSQQRLVLSEPNNCTDELAPALRGHRGEEKKVHDPLKLAKSAHSLDTGPGWPDLCSAGCSIISRRPCIWAWSAHTLYVELELNNIFRTL